MIPPGSSPIVSQVNTYNFLMNPFDFD